MMKNIFTPLFKGFLWSNVTGFVIIYLTARLVSDASRGGFIFSEFILVPVLMGAISRWFWHNLNLPGRKLVFYSIANTFIAILLSFIFLGEGVICLLIVSPLICCFELLGVLIAGPLCRWRNGRLNASFFMITAIIFMADAYSNHTYENKVSDTTIIKAPPARVWPNVVAFKRIQEKPGFWLFKIGLPSPVESTVTGYYKGAARKCIFSNNYAFDEVISTYNPGKNLVFDITHQPRDPEIMNHLDLERGQFLLKDNGDGTTTLTGNSWYRLYVFPAWYYDIWAKSIVSNVHTRVMQHIKELSEQ